MSALGKTVVFGVVVAALSPARARAADVIYTAGMEYTLSDDVVLSGADSLTAGDRSGARCIIHGAGHVISTSADGSWTGSLTIDNCDVDGLGVSAGKAIDVTGGQDITIRGTVFAASGQISLVLADATSVAFQNNTIKEDSLVRVVQESLDQSQPSFYSKGGSAGAKLFQGNRVFKSTIYFEGTGGWLIGGDTPAEGNVLVGFRTGIFIGRCGAMTIRGNYSHTLGAGWNQVKNLSAFSPSGGDIIAEHNVFIGCGWNTEVHGPGAIRYNLFVNPQDRAWVQIWGAEKIKVHHNLMVQTADSQHNTIQGGFVVFGDFDPSLSTGEPFAEIYNNTLDAGGVCNPGIANAVTIDGVLASLRSNAFVGIRLPSWTGVALVGQRAKPVPDPLPVGLGYSDYNLFYDTDASVKANYDVGVAGKTLRIDAGFAYNDVPAGGKADAQVAPAFAGQIPRTFPFGDGKLALDARGALDDLMIDGSLTVCQILAYYRRAYTPSGDSPLKDSGDPHEGAGNDIGAVGAGAPNDLDRFGKLCDPADVGSPRTSSDVFTCKSVPLQGGISGPIPDVPHGFTCVCQAAAGRPGPGELTAGATVAAAACAVLARRRRVRRG